MISERSLANLRMPKVKKEGHGYRYSLPQEKVDELFTCLAEGMSLKKASKQTGICFATAKKYFKMGDEKRGIKPLSYRISVFQDRISEKFNVLLEERRIKMLGTIVDTISVLEERTKTKVCKCCEGLGMQTDNTGLKVYCEACKGEGKIPGALLDKSSLKDLERFMRLEVFLRGGVTNQEREKKFMSAEEISGSGQQD